MVFKRRDRRPVWQVIFEVIYPRGGWSRAFNYVKHRVRRLPDTPEKISRGIWAGVFTTFTPFYGLHFVVAAIIAKLMRGNILAALMSTFFGNPLTYLPIAVASLQAGHFLLGTRPDRDIHESLGGKFVGAGRDLWHNFKAIFTPEQMDWQRLRIFFDEVFFPYMIGGIIPGIIAATIAYYISVPLIRAYQNRRRKVLRNKLAQLKKNIETDGSGQ
ncbi:MAG: hypothetical protein COB65_02175 [Thalassobium sp.]|uniref:DUF2062 domain-containing protein n=1 Tax=Octadecabacter sp. SW4 TaxID=2602067 RepID=UPI000C0E258E|nr:DUF2062 domain-containing protein [Octadecabacter sp. SW4]PHQ85847.1 MAG: hypothetical protein COB65_02175 [Thalassobium sp.]QEE34458.1 DUF2062 domain-containing protein [Octadecabacter sp. SW4]